MFTRLTGAIFIIAIAIFVFDSGDLHCCENDGSHGPVCVDCSCLICSSSLNSPAISSHDWNAAFCLLGNIKPVRPFFKFGELDNDIEQPPRF